MTFPIRPKAYGKMTVAYIKGAVSTIRDFQLARGTLIDQVQAIHDPEEQLMNPDYVFSKDRLIEILQQAEGNTVLVSTDPCDGEITLRVVELQVEDAFETANRVVAEALAEERYQKEVKEAREAQAAEKQAKREKALQQRAAQRERYKDPEYIEFLRHQSRIKEKYGEV